MGRRRRAVHAGRRGRLRRRRRDVGSAQAIINGFAADALLVMLVDSMIPQARRKAGDAAGLVTVLGFAVAAGLSGLS
jgi:zinc transporter ZupT